MWRGTAGKQRPRWRRHRVPAASKNSTRCCGLSTTGVSRGHRRIRNACARNWEGRRPVPRERQAFRGVDKFLRACRIAPEAIGRVRHDCHAVAGLLIAPGLQTFEPFDQRSIFLSNVAFELIPFTISDLLQPPTRRPVDLLFPSHRVVVDHADVVPQMRAVGRDRQGQILFLARLSTSTDTPKEDNCARNKI